MNVIIVATLLAVLVTGCASVPKGTVSYSLSPAELAAVQAGIAARARDPSSVQLAGVKSARTPDGTVRVCGQVNSKNGFGGYTGFLPFAGTLTNTGFNLRVIGDQLGNQMYAADVCNF